MTRLTKEEKEIIDSMRKDNKSYNDIAKVLNCDVSRFKRYCQKNKIGSEVVKNRNFEIFINAFNKKYGQKFIYISGYENCESQVLIKCKKCKHEFTRNARIGNKDKVILCDICKLLDKEEKRKEEKLKQKLEKEELKRLKLIQIEEARLKDLLSECVDCGLDFEAKKVGVKYCCHCRKKRRYRSRELNRRKKLKINGDIDKDISLERLIRKENNICYLCGSECDRNNYTITNDGHFVVGHNYPSIEHVIPVSKGGTHTWDNVKLAHHYCNTIKSDKLEYLIHIEENNNNNLHILLD